MNYKEKKAAEEAYNNLQFKDDYLFCKILGERPDIARELVELILGIKIRKVIVQKQKPIEITADGRGVRLDVYLEDDRNTVYDLEMQTVRKNNLPKRSRYYQGMIDLDMIGRGADFSELKKSYVIFICMDDPFCCGNHIYSFENTCKENAMPLGDGAYKIFLNASGTKDDVSEELKDFFLLLKEGKGESELSEKIATEVEKAKAHDEWRIEFMTLYMRDQEKIQEGMEKERAEIQRAISILQKQRRNSDEILRVVSDVEFRQKVLEQYLEGVKE